MGFAQKSEPLETRAAFLSPVLSSLLLGVTLQSCWGGSSILEECFKDPQYNDFLEIARNGLEKTAHPKHVVIVGAGVAGLSAAYALQRAGHTVRSKSLWLSSRQNSASPPPFLLFCTLSVCDLGPFSAPVASFSSLAA